jgi:hypothetical protein
MANMEMQEYKRKRDALSKIQSAIVSNGGPPDLRAAATEMMKNPEYLVQGRQLLQELDDTAKLEQYIAGQTGGKPSAANALAPNVPATPMMPGALGSGTFDIAPPPTANALASTAAPVANALAPAAPMDEVTKLEADIARLSGNTNPRAIAIVKNLEKRLEKLQPFAVGSNVYNPVTGKFIAGPKERTSTLRTPQELEQEIQINAARRQPRAERAPRTQVTQLADGSIALVNLDTGQIVPAAMAGQQVKGKLSAVEQKQQIQQSQLNKEIPRTIKELENISKEGGLIDQSTGSGAGRLIDIGARFTGQAMPGDIARGKLAPIADMVLKMIPRFEGPQSDKDTQSYKEAAGQLADSSLPREIRKAAAKEITRLMKERQGQFGTGDMMENTLPAAPSAPANIDALLDKYK